MFATVSDVGRKSCGCNLHAALVQNTKGHPLESPREFRANGGYVFAARALFASAGASRRDFCQTAETRLRTPTYAVFKFFMYVNLVETSFFVLLQTD